MLVKNSQSNSIKKRHLKNKRSENGHLPDVFFYCGFNLKYERFNIELKILKLNNKIKTEFKWRFKKHLPSFLLGVTTLSIKFDKSSLL